MAGAGGLIANALGKAIEDYYKTGIETEKLIPELEQKRLANIKTRTMLPLEAEKSQAETTGLVGQETRAAEAHVPELAKKTWEAEKPESIDIGPHRYERKPFGTWGKAGGLPPSPKGETEELVLTQTRLAIERNEQLRTDISGFSNSFKAQTGKDPGPRDLAGFVVPKMFQAGQIKEGTDVLKELMAAERHFTPVTSPKEQAYIDYLRKRINYMSDQMAKNFGKESPQLKAWNTLLTHIERARELARKEHGGGRLPGTPLTPQDLKWLSTRTQQLVAPYITEYERVTNMKVPPFVFDFPPLEEPKEPGFFSRLWGSIVTPTAKPPLGLGPQGQAPVAAPPIAAKRSPAEKYAELSKAPEWKGMDPRQFLRQIFNLSDQEIQAVIQESLDTME